MKNCIKLRELSKYKFVDFIVNVEYLASTISVSVLHFYWFGL